MKKIFNYFQNESISNFQIAGIALIFASVVANFFNFLYNAYLGRVIGLEEFGVISLIGSFLSLSQIPLSAFSRTITHRSAYLLGKYNSPVRSFWSKMRQRSLKPSVILTVIWLCLIPFFVSFFHTESFLPFLLLTPIWFIGIVAAIDSGYLSGNLRFVVIALMILAEVISKFVITLVLVTTNNVSWIYAAIPLSAIISFLIGWIAAYSLKSKKININSTALFKFPKLFYASSILTKVTAVAFLSADIMLAKHFLSAKDAGLYSMLSLVGKMVYFLGTLFTQFAIPLISRNEGAGVNSDKTFKRLLILTTLAVLIGFVGVGIFGYVTVPFLLGEKSRDILPFLPLYTFAMGCLPIASVIVSYHQSKEKHVFAIASFIFSVLTIFGIVLYHKNISEINAVITLGGVLYLLGILLLHKYSGFATAILSNFLTTIRFFSDKSIKRKNPKYPSVLIFNWRDQKHTWAGGAEVYIHELAKRLVVKGNNVTIFCGNDSQSPRNQVIDGVYVVRRGGFYTVYFWAFLYYTLKFRNKFDVIIDCENGIPFFTPLYTKIPVLLLIHHIHQDIFREHLYFPFSLVGRFLEGKLMPFIYRNCKIITISDSSKKEIQKVGLGIKNDIQIIHPGISPADYAVSQKTSYPSFTYLGRLKPYKNIDIAIKAFAAVANIYPDAQFFIAGEGESLYYLQTLVKKLSLTKNVNFLGKISENKKRKLLGVSWITLQPSMVEGWGITVIESNACATPVIASRVNGLVDSIVENQTGLLVKPKDITAWSNAMLELLENSQKRQLLSSQAYIWSRKFDWDSSTNQFQVVLNEVVTKKAIQKRRRFILTGDINE